MRITRRTAVEVRTRRITTVRKHRQPTLAWCAQCTARVQMAHAEPRAIYRRIEECELHFVATAAGELLICCPSLTSTLDCARTHPPVRWVTSYRRNIDEKKIAIF